MNVPSHEVFTNFVLQLTAGIILLLLEYLLLAKLKSTNGISRALKAVILGISILVVGILLFIFGYDKISAPEPDVFEIPPIIRELVAISDANTLRAKLDEYNKRGILAIGEREDFDNPDGFFVFVVGETRAYGTFLFHDNDFWDMRTNIRLADLPEPLRDKQQIWVIEADKLVQQ